MRIFGTHEWSTIEQMRNCLESAPEPDVLGVLCADGHYGYSQPVGGVVAYRNFISPSGVGYDIGCGNMAVCTNIKASDVPFYEFDNFADEILRRVSFGMGRNNDEPMDDPVFDLIRNAHDGKQRGMLDLVTRQLGTVGSGNHYVDVLRDEQTDLLWVAVHFGSRGFGHKTATRFMNIAAGQPEDLEHKAEAGSPPFTLSVNSTAGQDYIAAMQLAGEVAYAGRRQVIAKVLEILGNPKVIDTVHNHHNYAWEEVHGGQRYWVVRKGATPAFPGQRGFVGGSMGDISVILRGVDSPTSVEALYSTVHGAGRVMSRNQAIKGKHRWVCPKCSRFYQTPEKPPKDLLCVEHREALVRQQITDPINFDEVIEGLSAQRISVRGGGADETPQVYRQLSSVIDAHRGTVEILHTLRPLVVVMAPKHVKDKYKD